jgi:cellulose synthase/poly-beta-1,6-N-acetylglucosamine synthase-like glycosyltransferase
MRWTWLAPYTGWLFAATLLFNLRAAWKLAVDWAGMLTTIRFVRAGYARRGELPAEERLRAEAGAPVFLTLIAAYQEPGIAATLSGLLALRYPGERARCVVITKAGEDAAPHPGMRASTGALCEQFLGDLPPYDAKRLAHLTMPGSGRKAEQLNWALRPEALAQVLEGSVAEPSRVFVGVFDADSVPDPDTLRWIAGEELSGRSALAYQGVTLSLANWTALGIRGRICAVQQSSIFTRVSLARLINEIRRIRLIDRATARLPRRAARWARTALEFAFRRSQICLGHHQFVRLDVLRGLGGFPTGGATEDSTLGYMLGARGILIRPMPLIELTDLPETKEKIVRQNARWYQGVLDDVSYLWSTWRAAPTAFNLAQLVRHVVNKVVEWPVAAFVYPAMGYFGWHFAYAYRQDEPLLFLVAVAVPTVSLGLTVWVGGVVTQREVQAMEPYLPRATCLRWSGRGEWLLATFRCQTYWLLATRAAWRVLWRTARDGRYEPSKTDRVTRREVRRGLRWGWDRVAGGDRLDRAAEVGGAARATGPEAPAVSVPDGSTPERRLTDR